MPDYRLQPQKTGGYFAFLLALALLVLAGPAAITAFLPDNPREPEPVVLDALDFQENLTELTCPPIPDAESNGGWSCGDATVNYYAYPDIEDEDLLLRRVLRGSFLNSGEFTLPKEDGYLADETSLESNTASFIADPRLQAAAISIRGEGEHKKDFYVITIAGEQADVIDTASRIWKSAAKEELPPAALAELQEFDTYADTHANDVELEETLPV